MNPTIDKWIKSSSQILSGESIETARLDCLVMLENVLEKDRAWIAAHGDEALSDENLQKLNTFITQRQGRIPLAYILGSKEFYGREFYVDESALIPRPESETLIDLVKKLYVTNDINTVIDIGTGSGCLAISTKIELPDVHVTGIDISDTALKVARKNARFHKVQIQFKKHDLATLGIPNMASTRPYVVIANLPYVPEELITSPEITKEPRVALFSGKDGLHHYKVLWEKIRKTRHKPLAIITESLISQHKDLNSLAKDAGYICSESRDLGQLFIPTS